MSNGSAAYLSLPRPSGQAKASPCKKGKTLDMSHKRQGIQFDILKKGAFFESQKRCTEHSQGVV